MKNMRFLEKCLLLLGILFFTLIAFSCNKSPIEKSKGRLEWNFAQAVGTRAVLALPDTDDFILEVTDAKGNSLYKGKYGDSPSSMTVDPGSYTLKVKSIEFSKPEFDAPQFGDEQVAVVNAGAVTNVKLNCTQLNSGLRLLFNAEVTEKYSGGAVSLASSDGTLNYEYAEKRTAFFKPGSVSAVLKHGSSTVPLMTRNLEAAEMLTVSISCPSGGGENPGKSGADISISIDTSRIWGSEDLVIGEGDSGAGSSAATAYSVSQARNHIGEKEVWVTGYIVGGDLSSKDDGISFEAPFESKTNIAIASRSSVRAKNSCLSVQLSKAKIREELNLVDNPSLLGKKICLKGNIVEAYFGICGIQSVSEYVIK